MLTKTVKAKFPQKCCDNCVFRDGRFSRGGRKDPKFRKRGRAIEKTSLMKEIRDQT